MSLVKYAGVSLIAMSASMGHAGGMEATALSAGFMFEDGSYGSYSRLAAIWMPVSLKTTHATMTTGFS